jgi:hypothetical protein
MKKAWFLVLLGILAAGLVFAQSWGNGGAVQSVTVEGTLQLQNGQIAVAQGNTIYFVPMLERFIGFIDGLKEGAAVSISGYASGYASGNFLQPTGLTINGKSYDLQPANVGYGPGRYGRACCGGGFASARNGRARCW